MINEFNFSKIIEAASDKKIPLSFALLMSITDSNTNTKDLVEMLCSYINSIKRFEHNEDAKAWCELESKIKLLKQTNPLSHNSCDRRSSIVEDQEHATKDSWNLSIL